VPKTDGICFCVVPRNGESFPTKRGGNRSDSITDTESIFLYPNLRLCTVCFGDFQILTSVFGARVGGLDTFRVSQLEKGNRNWMGDPCPVLAFRDSLFDCVGAINSSVF